MAAVTTIEAIEQAALRLQPDARVRLAHFLVQSLAAVPDSEVLWLAEAERRDFEMESGQTQGVPGDEVIQRIQARYSK